MTVRQIKGDAIWEWPERDELGNCTRCHDHPVHCLCGEVVGHIKRWTLEELRERYDSYAVGENHHSHGYIGCFLDWLGEQEVL